MLCGYLDNQFPREFSQGKSIASSGSAPGRSRMGDLIDIDSQGGLSRDVDYLVCGY